MPITSVAVHAFPECKDVWSQLDSTSQKQLMSQGAMLWDAPDIEPVILLLANKHFRTPVFSFWWRKLIFP
jgi:hypothetical protein